VWTGIKRVLLFMVGLFVVLLGFGGIVSAILGYFGQYYWLNVGIAIFDLLLIALGVFLCRLAVRGTDKGVSDTGLL
jgi:hypothetical protein